MKSIREKINTKKSEEEADNLKIGEDAVTVDQLKAEWNAFVEMLKKEGRDREYNTLNQQVDFHEDLSIKLLLPNSFQSLTIEGLQQELLTHLRTKLNNNKIQLNTEIEKIENKKLIYTNSEKFDYLAEKYPNLLDLKKRLDLDTDF
jgi:DNA polymerase-3 subunit gamma/tau